MIAGFGRGLSVREVEAALADALGPDATLSKSTVSRVCEAIKDEFEQWQHRRLDDLELNYLFLDGSPFRYHANVAAERCWPSGESTPTASPVFVGLDTASSESGDAWEAFLFDLGERGPRCPLLVISDGAAGLVGAVERTMGAALRQRCLVHRARNILAKVPKNARAEVTADYWAIFDVPEGVEPGPDAVGYVQDRIDTFARRWRDAYPAAVRCLERTLSETRRRVKVIGRLPGEHSRLSLVWAVLDRASRGWRGFTMTPAGLRLLHDLRRSRSGDPLHYETPTSSSNDHPTLSVPWPSICGRCGLRRPSWRARTTHLAM